MMAARLIVPFLITPFSVNAGVVGDGLANLPVLLSYGTDIANSQLSKSDAPSSLGSENVRGGGWLTPPTSGLSASAHRFTEADAASGGTSQLSAPVGVTIVPNMTSFSGANGSRIIVGGTIAGVQNANQPWSLTKLDANTLQFSVESGDHWSTSGWSDLTDDDGANRSEIQFSQNYSAGTQINISETLTVEPGATNTASFLALNQLHATTNSPPAPFSLQLDQSDHLEVILQSPDNSYNLVYRSPNPIVRGQPMDLSFQLNMGPSGNGYVGVWLDGNQIVDYHGAVGATGSEYYWKEGIYRGPAAETITANFSNVEITTPPTPLPNRTGDHLNRGE